MIAGQLQVLRQQAGLAVAQRLELGGQHHGDGRVQRTPFTQQHRLVSRVAQQRMAEAPHRLAALLLGDQQVGLQQGVQRLGQRAQADR